MNIGMEQASDLTTGTLIDQLEGRLQRVEYTISGHLDGSLLHDDNRSAILRLSDLEQSLARLISKSRVAQDLLKLHARHSDFFHLSELFEDPSSLETASRASMVLAAASSFHQTASRLISIDDTPLPTSKSSTQLIDAAIKSAQIQMLQDFQLQEVSALKQRSAAVLQRWYSVDIIQVGECWADLEARVECLEQAVRRVKSAKQHDEGFT